MSGLSGFFRVLAVLRGMLARLCSVGGVVFVKLLGAIRTFEFMAFAGDSENGNGHKEDGEKFHRAASIATRRRNATPKAIFQYDLLHSPAVIGIAGLQVAR